MSNVTRLLPTLAVNGGLMRDFLAAPAPCFTLGVVEERRRPRAFLALRPAEPIPADVTAGGFNLGHALLGTSTYEVVQFAFQFYGFETYHVLVNPSNALAQTVLTNMVESGEYFFFAFAANQRMTAFRSEIGDATLTGLVANMARIQGSTTTEREYNQALAQFRRHPSPPGHVLEWVCRDNLDYLDLTQDRLDMNPRH
jgi:hypothetical protein